MKFEGKKLLVLGSNTGAVDIVKYAKSHGAYVYVADFYPPERSVAKQYADESLLISTAEVEKLSEIVKEKEINGVLSGISEFNLLKALDISQRNHLPFYFTKEKWDSIEDKSQFRQICEKFNVPCPKTYFIGSELDKETLEHISYPVYIKPVDASSSRGVFQCFNEEDLLEKELLAVKESESGHIIVEECVKGEEFTAHYTISNGKASLSCVDNRYPEFIREDDPTSIPIARIYPCVYIDEYIKQVNDKVLTLCENIGIENGIFFLQGLYDDETNTFSIFEAGLRSAGEAPFRFIKEINHINQMEVLVDTALGVPSSFDQSKEDPYLKGKCCGIVSFVTKGGTVGKIKGLEETLKKVPSVKDYELRYPVGSETPIGRTLRQLLLRFVMICESREQMVEDVRYLNAHIDIYDDKGNNMIIKMDPERIYGYK